MNVTEKKITGFWVNLGVATCIHLSASLVFILNLQFDLGCDEHDGAAGALTLAILLDLIASGVVLALSLRRYKHERMAVLAGWAASLLLVGLLFGVSLVYLSSLPTGCPV